MPPSPSSVIPSQGDVIYVTWNKINPDGKSVRKPYAADVAAITPNPSQIHDLLASSTLEYHPCDDFPEKETCAVDFLANRTVVITFSAKRDDNGPCKWAFVNCSQDSEGNFDSIDYDESEDNPDSQRDSQPVQTIVNAVQLKDHILKVEAEVVTLKNLFNSFTSLVLPNAYNNPEHRVDTMLHQITHALGKDLMRRPRKLVKLKLQNSRGSSASPDNVPIGKIARSFCEVDVPCSYADFQFLCKNAYAMLHDEGENSPIYAPTYLDTQSAVDSKTEYAMFFRTACAFFRTLRVHTFAAQRELLFSTRPEVRLSGSFAYDPECVDTPAICYPGRRWNGAKPSSAVLHDVDAQRSFPALYVKNTKYDDEQDRFRQNFRHVITSDFVNRATGTTVKPSSSTRTACSGQKMTV